MEARLKRLPETAKCLTMRERLHQFKQEKKTEQSITWSKENLPLASNVVNDDNFAAQMKMKRPTAARKIVINKSVSQNPRSYTKVAPVTAPQTPLGELKERMRVARLVSGPRRAPTTAEIKDKMEEAALIANTSGVAVARVFLEALPEDRSMVGLRSHAVYWLTWIRLELAAGEQGKAAELFDQALKSTSTAAGSHAIRVAREQFLITGNILHPNAQTSSSDSSLQPAPSTRAAITTGGNNITTKVNTATSLFTVNTISYHVAFLIFLLHQYMIRVSL
jgi:hypothetical protein